MIFSLFFSHTLPTHPIKAYVNIIHSFLLPIQHKIPTFHSVLYYDMSKHQKDKLPTLKKMRTKKINIEFHLDTPL